MTAITVPAVAERDGRFRPADVWRVVKLLAVNPSIYFGVPWMILGSAFALSLLIVVIVRAANPSFTAAEFEGMRNSWAVISPQWYLVVVGVQSISFTLNFALGLGSTRRDYWLGTSVMFVIVAASMATGIATLVAIEQATGGWWLGAHMFDALWYGRHGWAVDWFACFALQLFVLFAGAGVTTVYLRWRVRGMLTLGAGVLVLLLAVFASLTLFDGWAGLFAWFGALSTAGVFALLLGAAAIIGVLGYLVVRRATPR